MSNSSATRTLRDATRDLHADIEATPFAAAFLEKAIDVESYVGFIRVLLVVQAALERRLYASGHPLVAQVRSESLRRLPELLDDNEAFRWQVIPDSPKAVQAALKAASHILLASEKNPVSLLGCLYVLGGSTKGAVILAPLAKQTLGLSPGRGLSYLTRHGEQGPEEWEKIAKVLDGLVTDSDQIQAMTDTAVMVFECLLEAFEALWPLDRSQMKHMVTALNPEAGKHPIPQSRRDLLAVLRASERCLAEFPYFLYRYGRRGRGYTDSDGAWLATLPELGAEAMAGQVDWLAGVLSARGMPRLLLARHMQILAEELIAARPDQTERSQLLEEKASVIIERLDMSLPPTFRQDQIRLFERACHRYGDFAVSEAISLLASAVVDEADDLEGSVQSLMSWLTDPNRFPNAWVRTLQDILAVMRQELV